MVIRKQEAGLGKDELSSMGGACGESGVSEAHVCERHPGPVCKEPVNKRLDESRWDVLASEREQSARSQQRCPQRSGARF